MSRRLRAISEDEAGFSVAEVVIGATIMFFALTALVGLVGASQRMTVTAQDRSVLTNAIAQYADKIRSLDYHEVSTLPPDGKVRSSETLVVQGHNVNFNTAVETPDLSGGLYMKRVYIRANCTIRGQTLRTSAVVNIRNPRNDTTADRINDPKRPVMDFGDSMPVDYSLVFHNSTTGEDFAYDKIHDSLVPLQLAATASSADDRIVSMKFFINNQVFYAKEGRLAQQTWNPGEITVSSSWGWNTTDWLRPYAPVYDGLVNVVVQSVDSQTRESLSQRSYIVDNYAPVRPNTPRVTVQKSTLASFDVSPSADPAPAAGATDFTYATAFNWKLWKEPVSLVSTASAWTQITARHVARGESDSIAMYNYTRIEDSFDTEPFSRYFVGINALSPLGDSRIADLYPGRWDSGESRSATFISRPESYFTSSSVESSWTATKQQGRNCEYYVGLFTSRPTFPISTTTSPTVYLQRKESATSAWVTCSLTTSPTITEANGRWLTKIAWIDSSSNFYKRYYFRVGYSVNPRGWGGGTNAAPVYTNAVGPLTATLNLQGQKDGGYLYPDATWTQ